MDFLDPKKKRSHGIKLFIGYALVGVAIALAALILIFLAYGYGLDKSGTVIQNGILFVDSQPDDAEIYLNNERFKSNTDARIVLPSENYKLEIRKDGYRNWQRRFFLNGGEIQRYVYPLLFPTELKTSAISTYKTTPRFATQSPDRRWLLLQEGTNKRDFSLYDLNEDAPTVESVKVPASVLSGATKSFEVIEWANDNRHVLLKHRYKNTKEFIVFDRENPDESININTLTNGKFNRVSLRDKKYDLWYLHNTNTQRLFTARRSSPKPERILNGVDSYKSHGSNMLLYATEKNTKKNKADIKIWDDGRVDTLREVVKSPKYLLDVAQFDGGWYFVAGTSKDGKAYVYKDPFDSIRSKPRPALIPATIMRLDQPEFVSFSQNARFIAVQAGSDFAVYDAEEEQSYRYTSVQTIPRGQKAAWMDGHRLTTVLSGRVIVFDFDGANTQQLVASDKKFQPFFSSNFETLFAIQPKNNSAEADLTQTSLLVE